MVNLDYLYNRNDAMKNYLNEDCFSNKRLDFEVIDNGTILPYRKTIDGKQSQDNWGFGGIIDGDGNYLRKSFVNAGAGKAYIPPPN